MTPMHSSPEAFRKLMEADAVRWAEVIKTQKIASD
jgi:hypothetical protein